MILELGHFVQLSGESSTLRSFEIVEDLLGSENLNERGFDIEYITESLETCLQSILRGDLSDPQRNKLIQIYLDQIVENSNNMIYLDDEAICMSDLIDTETEDDELCEFEEELAKDQFNAVPVRSSISDLKKNIEMEMDQLVEKFQNHYMQHDQSIQTYFKNFKYELFQRFWNNLSQKEDQDQLIRIRCTLVNFENRFKQERSIFGMKQLLKQFESELKSCLCTFE